MTSSDGTVYPGKLIMVVLLSALLFFAVVVWQSFASVRDIGAVKAQYFRIQSTLNKEERI